jgi:acyl-CoA synthetase (AMP-forming)/AMP-acid ligase II
MTAPGNMADEILARAAARGDRPAFVSPDGTLTYAELVVRVETLARKLETLFADTRAAVPRVGVLCPGGVRHAVLMLAVMRAGGCAVAVAGELPRSEREALREATGLHGVLSTENVAWGERGENCGENIFWEKFTSVQPAFPVTDFEKLRPAFVRFSSGTTGRSKGVVLSHAILRERLDSANRRLGIDASDAVLWTLPMAHHFAVSILLYLRQGAAVVIPGGGLAADFLDAAVRHDATVFYGSPFQSALLAAEESGRKWPSLRLAVSTAAPLPAATAEKFASRYGKRLVQGLGIIEAGLPFLNTESPDSSVVGRAGDFEVRLDQGELCLRGPGMFDAYLSPWSTREEVMADGWFHTGDLARIDAQGDIRLTGRCKSVINVGGSKCFPEEIEDVLRLHRDVKEVRVRGEEHVRWGMLPVAEIVPFDPEGVPPAAALTDFCRARLAAYKVPVRFNFVASLPTTASGKIRRGQDGPVTANGCAPAR